MTTLSLAIDRAGVTNGATISFHHHLRNGDDVMRQVIQALSDKGLRDLTVAPSSLFPCHESLIPYLENGTITGIHTAYMTGPLANAVAKGALKNPAILTTHGGRARAIEAGELKIDAAFIAAPAATPDGNLTGAIGPNACGPLGYAMVDAAHAHTIAITDHIANTLPRTCIPATHVDQLVRVDSIGSNSGVVSGTTARSPSKDGQKIADMTARLIACSGLLKDGFSFQTGAGATSLAVAHALRPLMTGITGSFAAGGITAPLVAMHRDGLFAELRNVQAFDLTAVESYATDPHHHGMTASAYANPDRADAYAHKLDVMILGAAQVDTDFNVNVTRSGDGRIIGGSGGHADTAEGAKLAIVTTTTQAGAFPKIVDRLTTRTTPGTNIGAVVTERGIAIHPARPDLRDRPKAAGLPLVTLADLAQPNTHIPETGRVIAICQDRRGTQIDTIRA